MDEVLLREYAPADFEALYRIDQACYPPGIAYTRRMLRWFLAQPGRLCLVAELHGEPVGFLVAICERTVGHIVTIDVLERHRRRGLGTRMLVEAERRMAAAGVRTVELETATTNHAAIAFWRKHGYRTSGVLRSYYSDGQDAYGMYKSLGAGAGPRARDKSDT
jgi:ribosomal-protein-alanine N-acetyltransferase